MPAADTSDADVAYDTAIEHAVGQGFGFWRINTRYSCDDAFDQDIVIERIANPFTVYGDPNSTAADSSDWNVAFIVTSGLDVRDRPSRTRFMQKPYRWREGLDPRSIDLGA